MLFRNMSRTYWDRWQWELQQRRHYISLNKVPPKTNCASAAKFQEIDPKMLLNPGSMDDPAYFVARGSFAVVKLQSFRGIKVAVKELLPRTNLVDVHHEAFILARLSHPYLPYLFGICITEKPYRIVIQFEGISSFGKEKHYRLSYLAKCLLTVV